MISTEQLNQEATNILNHTAWRSPIPTNLSPFNSIWDSGMYAGNWYIESPTNNPNQNNRIILDILYQLPQTHDRLKTWCNKYFTYTRIDTQPIVISIIPIAVGLSNTLSKYDTNYIPVTSNNNVIIIPEIIKLSHNITWEDDMIGSLNNILFDIPFGYNDTLLAIQQLETYVPIQWLQLQDAVNNIFVGIGDTTIPIDEEHIITGTTSIPINVDLVQLTIVSEEIVNDYFKDWELLITTTSSSTITRLILTSVYQPLTHTHTLYFNSITKNDLSTNITYTITPINIITNNIQIAADKLTELNIASATLINHPLVQRDPMNVIRNHINLINIQIDREIFWWASHPLSPDNLFGDFFVTNCISTAYNLPLIKYSTPTNNTYTNISY